LTNPNPESIFKSSPLLILFSLSALGVAIWWRPLASWFALALRDEQYTHILLVLPMSAALIFLEWKSPAVPTRLSATIASPLLLLALSARALVGWKGLSTTDVQLSLNILALLAWWTAAFILSFGTGAFRRALVPLCFLLWMVPLPQFILNPIVTLLQQGSAGSAHLLFAAVGIPIEQTGMLVQIPGLTMEVAPECSSIRSSLMLVVTTMILAQLFLRSWWRKVLLIAAAVPLSVAKNGLRIFVIAELGTRVDPDYLTGSLHHHGGGVFFAISVIGVAALLLLLRRTEVRTAERNFL